MTKLESGKFYVLTFGRGTQLVFVESISKTGKRAVVRRCQAWKKEAHWDIGTSTISVTDRRIQGEIERIPANVPNLPSELYCEQISAYGVERRKLWRKQAEENDAARARCKDQVKDVACDHLQHCWTSSIGNVFHDPNCAAQKAYDAIHEPIRVESQRKHLREIDELRARIVTNEETRSIPR